MIRLLSVVLVLLFVGAGFSGCEDDQSSQASELGLKEGRRPVAEKRPPPGPGDGGFKQGEGDEVPQDPPPPPDN